MQEYKTQTTADLKLSLNFSSEEIITLAQGVYFISPKSFA